MSTLAERIGALETLVEIRARNQVALPDELEAHRALAVRSRERLGHGTSFVIAALAGPTGAGKSTLFNALAGVEVAQTGVRRPTTFETQALIWGEGADAVCDWLGVHQRHHAAGGAAVVAHHEGLDGLILLDLPDFDSVAQANRAEVDRLVALVDMFVWVTDPQKYADESLHHGYISRLREHGDVMRFVLSKSDTLETAALDACVADFARLLTLDGLADPVVLPVSAKTGEGVPALESRLADAAAERAAIVQRVDADLRSAVAGDRSPAVPETRTKAVDRRLVDALATAAGADDVGRIAAAQHTQDGRARMGWPLLRWVQKFRKRPITELPSLRRSATMESQVDNALRNYADDMAEPLEPLWARSIGRSVRSVGPEALQRLDAGVTRSWRDTSGHPRWWAGGAALQWTAFTVAAVGLVWLLLLFVFESFLRVSLVEYTPEAWNAPLPTWLLLGGLVAGLVLTLLLRIPLAAGAKRRSLQASSQVRGHAQRVADELVLPAAQSPLDDAGEVSRLENVIAG